MHRSVRDRFPRSFFRHSLKGEFSEVSVSAMRCLVGQLVAAVRGVVENQAPRVGESRHSVLEDSCGADVHAYVPGGSSDHVEVIQDRATEYPSVCEVTSMPGNVIRAYLSAAGSSTAQRPHGDPRSGSTLRAELYNRPFVALVLAQSYLAHAVRRSL